MVPEVVRDRAEFQRLTVFFKPIDCGKGMQKKPVKPTDRSGRWQNTWMPQEDHSILFF